MFPIKFRNVYYYVLIAGEFDHPQNSGNQVCTRFLFDWPFIHTVFEKSISVYNYRTFLDNLVNHIYLVSLR